MADDKGYWLDTQANKVVQAAPVEGVQLAAPGVELTAEGKAAVERARALTGEDEAPPVETAVSNDSVRSTSRRKAKD